MLPSMGLVQVLVELSRFRPSSLDLICGRRQRRNTTRLPSLHENNKKMSLIFSSTYQDYDM
jgi:hypothetical protein